MSVLPDELRTQGIYGSYEQFVRDFHPILRRMQERGVLIDLDKRETFRAKVQDVVDVIEETIQKQIPVELKIIHPKAGIQQWPEEIKIIRNQVLAEVNSTIPKKKDHIKKFSQLSATHQYQIIQRIHEEVSQEYRWKTFPLPNGGEELRPFKFLSFNPASPKQMMDYIRHKGYAVPKNLEGKETTGRKELERLAKKTGDIVLNSTLELRKNKKVVSTYINGWSVGSDSSVHTTFTFAPATWQLSSRAPNIQNVPKHGELAKEFRKCIVAKPGHVLVEADYKSFHMLTLGFCAGDERYMRLARLDGHSYLASHLLHIPEATSGKLDEMSDEEFLEYVKWFKSDKERKFVRDKKAKPTILGYGFGLQARKLYDMNVESFKNKAEAQGVITMLDGLFPLTAQYRDDIKKLAHEQGFLISPWGAIRRFNSVFVYDERYGWKSGDDAERAIAFNPANCAFGKVREAMIDLAKEELDEKYGMVNTVHDSLVFNCPKVYVEEALHKVREIMERPASVLVHAKVAPNGLSCAVEASVGEDWGNLEEVKL